MVISVIAYGCVLAVPINGFHPDTIQPVALRAPEVILGCEWGPSADVWNLGCLVRLLFAFLSFLRLMLNGISLQIFEFLTSYWLFVPQGGPTWTAEAYHLAHMPAMAGEDFDAAYVLAGKHGDKYFDNDGESIR